MEQENLNKKWYPVEYAGYWHIQDSPYYEGNDLLDEEMVGSMEAHENAKLAASAPELLKENTSLKNELEELKKENERLKGLIDIAWDRGYDEGYEHYYSNMHNESAFSVPIINLEMFKKENNIE